MAKMLKSRDTSAKEEFISKARTLKMSRRPRPLAGAKALHWRHFGRSDDGQCGLPRSGALFEHAKSTLTASRIGLSKAIKGIQKSHDFRPDLHNVLIFGLQGSPLLCLDSSYLLGEELRLNGVQDGEHEVTVYRWFSVPTNVRKVANYVWFVLDVVENFGLSQLFVLWYLDSFDLSIGEVLLVAVHDSTEELHGAVATLRKEYLACRHASREG